jgi:tRNA-dihydrouridine synthase C
VTSHLPTRPRLILLAPMEGLLDHSLRDAITLVGGVDRCVSEFIRITDQLLPTRVFTRVVPELLTHGRTACGTPVRPQLLGGDPACMADNAARLAQLQPCGVDLNFGCPAPTVNRHRGGAVLLDEPELVHAIVAAVRRAVPAHVAVSAKMRLGNQCEAHMLDCAHAIASAGACELVVHARTKLHGYRPPAYWERIADIRTALASNVSIDVVANGEVWTVVLWRLHRPLFVFGTARHPPAKLGGLVALGAPLLATHRQPCGTAPPRRAVEAVVELAEEAFCTSTGGV